MCLLFLCFLGLCVRSSRSHECVVSVGLICQTYSLELKNVSDAVWWSKVKGHGDQVVALFWVCFMSALLPDGSVFSLILISLLVFSCILIGCCVVVFLLAIEFQVRYN